MRSALTEPKGWPSGIQYLHTPSYSKHLSGDIVAALNDKPASEKTSSLAGGPSINVAIRAIHSGEHPAHGQYGLFAAKNLPPDSVIIHYIGVIHGQDETDETSDYDLSLDRELKLGIDASKAGNEARFINDYRGISTKGPNADFRDTWVETNGRHERRMSVFVLPAGKSGKRAGGIKKGEEILVSYGKGFWNERQQTGSKN
jgi:SET domain-containing protein